MPFGMIYGGQLGLPSPLLQKTSGLQEHQTERKRRECLRSQEKLRSKVNSSFHKSLKERAYSSLSSSVAPAPRL